MQFSTNEKSAFQDKTCQWAEVSLFAEYIICKASVKPAWLKAHCAYCNDMFHIVQPVLPYWILVCRGLKKSHHIKKWEPEGCTGIYEEGRIPIRRSFYRIYYIVAQDLRIIWGHVCDKWFMLQSDLSNPGFQRSLIYGLLYTYMHHHREWMKLYVMY